MGKRLRLVFLLFVALAAFLAYGAWQQKPDDGDGDNQGGAAFALLGILFLICFTAVKITRAITGRFHPREATQPQPRADAEPADAADRR
jgi:hypothetical protein